MTWNVIRKATQEDRKRLERRALAFAKRHGMYDHYDPSMTSWVNVVEWNIAYQIKNRSTHPNAYKLRRLWQGVVNRTLNTETVR